MTSDEPRGANCHPATVVADDTIRIGVYIDGGFWFHLTYYWLKNHPMGVRLAVDGVADAVRWHARHVFDRPVERIRIHRTHWVQGAESAMAEGFAAMLDRLGVVRHHMPFNPNGRTIGQRVELALTAWDEAYDDYLDMVALLSCDDEYLPLIRRLTGEKVRVLVPRIKKIYAGQHGGKKRRLVTSPHLSGAATDSPDWEDLVCATEVDAYREHGLISPFLWDSPTKPDAARPGGKPPAPAPLAAR